MRFKLKDPEMELGYTAIENIFIDEFLPSADGRFVKVYLFAFRHAKSGKINPHFNHAFIAKRLELPISEVIEAWEYWEKMGVVERIYGLEKSDDLSSLDFDIIFNNLTELYINSALKAKYTTQNQINNEDNTNMVDQMVFANQNPILSEMFKKVEYHMRRKLVPNEKNKLIDTMNCYSIDPEVISYASQIADKKGINKIKYIIGIVRNWHDDGIRTGEDARKYIMNSNPENFMGASIKKALGSPEVYMNKGEKIYLEKWIEEYDFELEMILKACEYTGSTTKASFSYIDPILKAWHKNGIKTVEEASEYQKKTNENHKSSKKAPSKNYKNKSYDNSVVKTKFHNFEQASSKYTEEELFTILMGDKLRKK